MRRILFFLITTTSFLLNAQTKRSNNWVTGYSGNRIDFSNNTITTHQGIYFPFKYFTGGNSCISDTNGNLKLTSDGFNIYRNDGSFVDEGDTLIPQYYYTIQDGWSSGSQTSIFLPMDSAKYYFITPTFSDVRYDDCHNNNGNCYFDLLLYNVIDMNANGGLGKVTKRMVPLMENASLRKTQMMACRHGNGKDWWLLKNEGDNADVHTFLFTQDSVYDKGVQTFAQPNWGPWDIRGQSAFSADGAMFATTSHCSSCGLIFIADFDRCYGILSNPMTIQMPVGSQQMPNDSTLTERLSTGLAFSPNGKFLYVMSHWNVYQYDLQDNTWFHISGIDTTAQKFQGYETAYIASDNKIYIGNFAGLSKQMSSIDNPDVKGAGCNFCPRCLRLDSLGANAYVGTPPCMPNYGLGARTCWPLSISQYANEPMSQLEVYPNPACSTLYIKTDKPIANNPKELYNSVGQLILSTIANEMDVSRYSKGVYYLKCGIFTRKVIIE
ncbi:MAG: T9SS type A sorting domain-containing protein [Chitinophagaceae bacterium]